MEVEFTDSGDLSIVLEESNEWVFFDSLIDDAGSSIEFTAGLTEKMSKQEGWGEFVVPELVEQFDTAIQSVGETIHQAIKTDSHVLTIKRSNAEAWYQVLNQARLQMERKYRFSELQEGGDIDDLTFQLMIRDRFYLQLQSLLLDRGMI